MSDWIEKFAQAKAAMELKEVVKNMIRNLRKAEWDSEESKKFTAGVLATNSMLAMVPVSELWVDQVYMEPTT
jgi:uncharacterized membrane protein